MYYSCFFSGSLTANDEKSDNTPSLNRGSSISTQIKGAELRLQLGELNPSKNVPCEIHVSGIVHVIKSTSQFADITYFLSCLQFQFLTAEEAPEEPPPVADSATLKHFAREAEVDHN